MSYPSSYSSSPSYSAYSSSTKAPSPPQKVLSCAECRRSKLRCDRVFPCETCRKRGLEHLCPNEALVTRPNLAADAEYLRIENMRLQERVRQLEGLLYQSQADAARHTSSSYYQGYGGRM